jgi:2-aminoethylphosphonate-pyruvate transaminase
MFTPGPPPSVKAGLNAIGSAFGRGDPEYLGVRQEVLEWLLEISGQGKIIDLQGSGSLAIEIMIRNFLVGRVLVVRSGYYSDRITEMCNQLKDESAKNLVSVTEVDYKDIQLVQGDFDWVIAVYVETSVAFKQDIFKLRALADRCGAQLALDAVASIGLEVNHKLADVVAFSSCKGLLGITGAAFVAYKNDPMSSVASFYMNVSSHEQKLMTGPYAQIQYLHGVMQIHTKLVQSVITNKNKCLAMFGSFLVNDLANEPYLCTRLSSRVKANRDNVILYVPRSGSEGAVINHLGEVPLGINAAGAILRSLEVLDD